MLCCCKLSLLLNVYVSVNYPLRTLKSVYNSNNNNNNNNNNIIIIIIILHQSKDRQSLKKGYSFNLYVNVKNFVCRIGENAQILLTLFDAKENTFISEHYIMKWGEQGMLKDLDSFSNMRVIYTDLNEKDISNDKIFLVCQIIRLGRMDLKEPDSKKLTHGMKRPFGVASIDVSDILKGKMDSDDEKQYFIPFLQCGEHDFMEVVIKKSILAKDINHKGQGLWVTMRNLVGDMAQLQKEYPHLLTNTTSIARKMGFPDVIMPGDVRNDLYVTIKQGEFKKGGNKMADKNIQVTLTICNENGEVINGMISEGSSGSMVNQFETIIYYHEDRPKWYETVKVSIPVNDSNGVHLKFTMKHRSTADAKDKAEKPFAMSYIQLMNDDGTILNNTDHDLLVYKMDSKKSEDQTSAYFRLPATQKDLQKLINSSGSALKSNSLSAGSYSLSASDVFQISTLICSTKLTHNVELMGLLKWRDNPQDLETLLNNFMSVDGGEVVKFLQDTLDALFNILIENSDSDLYDKLVFDALVFLLSIVSDHKYNQFKPVLDVYIKDSFSATLAYTKLMLVLKMYISDVFCLPKTQSVIKAFKTLDYIFKFIVHSRLLFAALHENKGKQQFELLLGQLFGSVNKMIKEGREMTNGVCAMFLNILPSIIPHILQVYNQLEFSEVLIECINSVPPSKLVLRKMHCINELVHSQLFKFPDCRQLLLPVFLDHVHQLLTNHVDTMPDRQYWDPTTNDYIELEICFKILSDMLDYLFTCDAAVVYENIKVISIKMLRLVTKTVIFIDKGSPLAGTCVAVMTAILRQMTEQHYSSYISNFETPFDLLDFLMEILMIIEELVMRNVYPFDWSEMIGLQNWVFMTALRYFSNTIRNQFSTPFYFELWKRFFLSSIAFIIQKPLQLEDFSPSKRNKIVSQYKDMRREASLEVRSMWHSLGQNKIDFIPEMIGPFLQMTLTRDKELRKWTIPLFFDMMKVELNHTIKEHGSTYKKNFYKFEQELVAQIDELVTSNHGDESYQELFYEIIKEHCENYKAIKDQGLLFNETIKQLFQLLLQYRTVLKEDNYDNKMICTVSLLNFYNESNRNELYIRYLNKLCALHLECNNRTEAGYTLLLYAKLLKWSDDPLPPVLMSPHFPDLKTHRKLKERLYCQITTYFDEGKMWEKAIELCKELASQYEIETFDYPQLANMLRKQAGLYDKIMTTIRPEPEYFRVAYYGMGFHPFLQNRTFIYRGKDYERLSDFITRLLNQFPNAQLMKTLNAPNDSIRQQQNKFIQVNKVTPIMELNNNLASKRLSDQILRYFKVNEVQKFTYSRKKEESVSNMSMMWLERTVLVTSYPFPGILHWFPVTSTQTFDVSPLELAIETLEETNQKLKSLVEQLLNDPTSKIDQLGMVLNGVVDAAVNGGIANYKVFYTEGYLKDRTPEERKMVDCLKRCTTLQVIILREALNLHSERAPENLKPFQSHLEQRYAEMKNTLEKEYGIKV
ncbi:hypothetical protein HELRODRAFT_109536 [Helobdella robusta]|uniref:Dedicator of cytokinesis protein 1 n=1 Tax=Helobdella robusta TaxID=6412 RepID=T1EEU6_HELRO|nr:hypothetical protein HELRODRAFT_109536 [Helobdella robusta]ESO09209.1 hypothetical protein HELRODRAFT_109536 [Helobdella robusta]